MRVRTMHARPVPLAVLAVATALVSSLAACQGGSGPASDGPLSSGSGIHAPIPKGSICTPDSGPQTSGFQVFTNYGKTTVVLDRVALLHPRNQRLLGAYAVPAGDFLVGNPHGWPPRETPLPSTWRHRQPVHGFQLAPGKTFNMVLGVAPVSTGRSTSQGILVYYHDSSGTYVSKNFWAEIIAGNPHGC